MKKLITIFLLLFSLSAMADDTAALNAACASGNFTLTRNYSISGQITVTYLLHLNGYTVSSSQTTGAIFRLSSTHASIDGGTIQGGWSYLTTGSTTGVSGVVMVADYTSLTNVTVKNVSSYGVNAAAANHVSVTGCTISATGYIGFHFDGEPSNTSYGTFTNNTVDRSMISPSAVLGLAVGIQGSVHGGNTATHWTITGNTIKMPLSPSSVNDECFEARYLNNSNISHNTCINGSIGLSIINLSTDTVAKNVISGAKWENIEYGQVTGVLDSCNKATGGIGDGILIDGNPTNGLTLIKDTVSGQSLSALHTAQNTTNLTVKNCVLHSTSYQKVVNIQKSNYINFIHTDIDGGSFSGSTGVYFDTSPGNANFTGGSIKHCTYQVFGYNTGTGAVVDSIFVTGADTTGTPTRKGSYFTNGAHYGSHISFLAVTLTFGALPAKTYGDIDFPPGAVSGLAVTYTSSNTAVATIVSGNIHIVGAGSCNITATNADTSLTQGLTVGKANLSIYANPQIKQVNTANPTLTATFVGFVNGETNTVLTTQPTLTTTATLSSPASPPSYVITNSGATAANYNITNYNSVLIIYGGPVLHFLIAY